MTSVLSHKAPCALRGALWEPPSFRSNALVLNVLGCDCSWRFLLLFSGGGGSFIQSTYEKVEGGENTVELTSLLPSILLYASRKAITKAGNVPHSKVLAAARISQSLRT